jgi:hypothetical protein
MNFSVDMMVRYGSDSVDRVSLPVSGGDANAAIYQAFLNASEMFPDLFKIKVLAVEVNDVTDVEMGLWCDATDYAAYIDRKHLVRAVDLN